MKQYVSVIKKIYKKIFSEKEQYREMGYDKSSFEQKVITPFLMSFIKHLIKLRLCDKSFSDNFYKDLYVFAKYYKNDWMKQSKQLFLNMFEALNKKVLNNKHKTDTKELAYLSVVDNIDSELYSGDSYDAVKRATSQHKNRDTIKSNAKKYFTLNYINKDSTHWFKEIIEFLIDCKPDKNSILPTDVLEKKIDAFIKKYVSDFNGN